MPLLRRKQDQEQAPKTTGGLKAFGNSDKTNFCFELVPTAGTTLYSVWHEAKGHRTADVPVAPGTNSVKFFMDPAFGGEIWSDGDVGRGDVLRFWRNDEDPELPAQTVPMTGGDGSDGGVTEPPIEPVDPPPTGGSGGNVYNITIQGGSLPQPRSGEELQLLIDSAAANGYVLVLAPNTVVDIDRTIILRQERHGGERWGLDGNYAKFNWVGPGGQDVFRAEGVTGMPNRGFTFGNCEIFGNGYAGNPARSCLAIICPAGDDSAYYKLQLQNIYTSYAEHGFYFEGAIFEFSHINLHAENHRSHGMVAVTSSYAGGSSVMSNAFGIAPNMSRNGGSGIYTSYSHNIEHGSFINNNRYGIEAPDGLRVAVFNNGENTGESLIKMGYAGPGSLIFGNEMSCGGMAVANFGLPSTGLSKYVLDAPAGNPDLPNNQQPQENRVTPYHNGVGLDCKVRK